MTLSRRRFLAVAGAGAGLLAVGGCAGPAPTAVLDAAPVGLDLAGRIASTWGYNGAVPGPEIRVREGDTLRVPVRNGLPEPTSVHWHGIALANAMDGTPGLTQDPVAPGAGFDYEFVVPEPGTHWYHSHSGHQLDRGLYGALIVDPHREELAYDREYVLLLDDWRDGLSPGPEDHSGHVTGGDTTGGDPAERVSFGGRAYPLVLVNARPPADPAVLQVRRGDRVRLRVVNAAADTGFRFAVGGHRLTVTHTDGMPVEPVTVDAVRLGMGERVDVLLDAVSPGAWQVAAAAEGRPGLGRAVLRYLDAPAAPGPPADARPAELDGRLLRYADLAGTTDPRVPATGVPDRTIGLTLRGTDIDSPLGDGPLAVAAGEWVRFTVANDSAKWHPVHLHGHHFRVSGPGGRGPRKDTAAVPARGGALVLDWRADNPGDWMFHCHNHYHMEDGMMRTITY